MVLDNSTGDASVVWILFCILLRVGLLTTPFLFSLLNLFVVIFDQFSFLMRTILNFIVISFSFVDKKESNKTHKSRVNLAKLLLMKKTY